MRYGENLTRKAPAGTGAFLFVYFLPQFPYILPDLSQMVLKPDNNNKQDD